MCHKNSYYICILLYIQSNAAQAYNTVATDAAHSTSCVSTLDDAEENMNAGPGDKKTDDEEEAALDDAEGNIQKKGVSVLGCFCISSYMIWIHSLNESMYSLLFWTNSYIKWIHKI